MDKPIYESNGLYGDTINPILQNYSDTCAIKSQQIILNEFGLDVTEDQLVKVALEKGWYTRDGSGTTFENVGNLLEYAGIDVTRQVDANVFSLVSELSQGHKVIVGVDSGELWRGKIQGWFKDFFIGDTPDHAIVVAGIDTSDPNNVMVIVDDPGTGDYHKAYPLGEFMDAWSDSQCYMVATNDPVPLYPENASSMGNFDYTLGHIADVGGMDYSDFQVFCDISQGLPIVSDIDGERVFPISSLTKAYRDVVNSETSTAFNSIFDHDNYIFNDYLETDIATQCLHQTFTDNAGQIRFESIGVDGIDFSSFNSTQMSDFLNDSINDFIEIGDFTSASLCHQQLMMTDFCDINGLPYSTIFF